jgi:cyclic beta-1,2-glucan synthetase
MDAPIKFIEVTLENTLQRPRRITATYYAEWVLGPDRQINQLTLVPEFDPTTGAMLARNPYNTDFGERVAFLAANQSIHGFTCDRTEFLGERGNLRSPAALNRIGLSSTFKPGLDPCAVIQIHINLNPGEQKTFHFLLGEGATREESQHLIRQYSQSEAVAHAWKQIQAFWVSLLNTLTVKTPDSRMDLLLNRWLLYQTLSCRIWGRSALYQSSGAFGYRDQLQDVLALMYARPDLIREHILRAARYQFVEGDVLHWWHPPSGRGVRTRYTDDLLWLPYVTAAYVQATDDVALLQEVVPFLQGPRLEMKRQSGMISMHRQRRRPRCGNTADGR